MPDNEFLLDEEVEEVEEVDLELDAISEPDQELEIEFAMQKIHGLIGAEEFEAMAEELCRLGGAMSDMYSFFGNNTYLFSIDDGCGLTTALQTFAELLHALKLLRSARATEFRELEETREPAELSRMKEALTTFLSRNRNGGVLCIDLSRCYEALSRAEYRELLRICYERRSGVLVFRIPFVEPHVQKQVVEVLNDLFYVHAVTFDPFSTEELFAGARLRAKEFGFSIDDDMLSVIADMLVREKSDGHFCGMRSMQKIVTQLIYEKLRSGGEGDRVLRAEDFAGQRDAAESRVQTGEEMLRGLIGMEDVANQIDEIISLVEYARANGSEIPSLHMRFVGPPGTGKTTVARMVGLILKQHGILRTGIFRECNGNDLIAKHVGHTASRVMQTCRDAYGGVLFIDEAYVLACNPDSETGSASFRMEAVTALLSQMENHRGDMIVIMAGYEHELDELMRTNPGFAQRMPYVVRFDSYSREDLAEIFFRFAEEGPGLSAGAREHIRVYFQELPNSVYHSPTFANARFVRNLYERALSKAALRFRLERPREYALLEEDFDGAANEITDTLTASMVYGKDRSGAVMFEKEVSSVCFADVCGEEEAKELLAEMIDFLKAPEKYREIGATIPKGALLVGPPGTGKTMLARAAAAEAGTPVLTISGADLVCSLRGEGAERIRSLFAQARKLSPCMVFIDEIDTIAVSRNYGGDVSALSQLLTEMDGVQGSDRLLVLAATNRPEVLDPALTRPGRFDREIPVELPDAAGREEILRHYLDRTRREEEVAPGEVARLAAGMSGADLMNVVNEAALRALRDGRARISQGDLEESVETAVVGYRKRGTLLTPEEKWIVCYHETGHALAAALLTQAAPVKKITVLPRTGGALGYTVQSEAERRCLYTRAELEERILLLTAGRAAEEIHFQECTTDAADDIVRATQLARQLVTRYGMTEEFDMVCVERAADAGPGAAGRMDCSDATARLVDEKVVEIVREQHGRALGLLLANEDSLDRLARAVYEKETISGEEFMALLSER